MRKEASGAGRSAFEECGVALCVFS